MKCGLDVIGAHGKFAFEYSDSSISPDETTVTKANLNLMAKTTWLGLLINGMVKLGVDVGFEYILIKDDKLVLVGANAGVER